MQIQDECIETDSDAVEGLAYQEPAHPVDSAAGL